MVHSSENFGAQDHSESVIHKPRLSIMVEGGAMCSQASLEGPDRDVESAIGRLMKSVPQEIIHSFGEINFQINQSPVAGKEIRTSHINQFGVELQNLCRQTSDNVLAIVDASKAPCYAAASTFALSRQDLVVPVEIAGSPTTNHNVSDVRRSVLLVCSRLGLDDNPTEAYDSFRSALQLSADRRMTGKGGLLHRDNVYSLSGLGRTNSPEYFTTMYPTIAERGERGNWYFSKVGDHHMPFFAEDSDNLKLNTNVHTLLLDEDAHGLDEAINKVLSRFGHEKDPEGFVMQIASPDELTEDALDDLESLEKLHFPIMLSGIPKESEGSPNVVDQLTGKFSSMIDARELAPNDAKIALAYWLAKAKGQGITDKQETIDFVRRKLTEHSLT